MKQVIFIWLIISICLQGLAQNAKSLDSLNHIINESHNSPESRVLACVYQGEYYINKRNNLDSATICLKRGQQLSKVPNEHTTDGELLFLEALINKKKGSRADGNRLNELAVTLLRKKPGTYFLGEALMEKGDYLNIDDDKQLKQKTALLREAVTCFNEKKYTWIRAGIWKSLGDLYGLRYENTGNIALALEAYQRSMDAYFSFGYKNVQDIYIEMASIYRDLGDNQRGLHYSLLAIQTAERARDTSFTLCQIYNQTGIQYLYLLDLTNARKYLNQALKLAEKFKDLGGSYSIAMNLYVAYRRDKEYNNIKPLIDQVHSRFPENDVQNQIWSNTLYLDYYTDVKDVINGKKYCLY